MRATSGLELDVTRLLADIDQKLIQAQRSIERAGRMATEFTDVR